MTIRMRALRPHTLFDRGVTVEEGAEYDAEASDVENLEAMGFARRVGPVAPESSREPSSEDEPEAPTPRRRR